MISDRFLETDKVLQGSEKLMLTIGGFTSSIICQDVNFLQTLRARYRWFESTAPPQYEIILQVLPLEELSLGGLNTVPGPTITNTGDSYVVRQAQNPFTAIINTSSRKALVKLWNSEYSFDNFFRLFYTLILAKEGGLLLHAAAVMDNGRGSVFFGPSGSGKTTVARLAGKRTVLTDELALVKRCNGSGKYRVYGTPFWGEFTPGRSNARAELTGLYALKKDKTNSLRPVDRVAAVAALYRCVLFFSHDVSLLRSILDTCCSLLDSVPVYELGFRKDDSFWQVIQ